LEPVRKHGKPPYSIAVIHGGPGATGDMRPVAEVLSQTSGVLEPYQQAFSINGLIEELKNDLRVNAQIPVVLIGHSWGAWLSMLFASAHPETVKKIVLVGCPPIKQEYVPMILKNRLSRLDPEGQIKFAGIIRTMKDPVLLQSLLRKTDAFDPVKENAEEGIPLIQDHYRKIWNEAEEMRLTGGLMEKIKMVRCPVTAIHGDHDPHPAEGVREPLSVVLTQFHFILLEKCGHYPWKEKQAKDEFFRILKKELL
jgi:pimeloyl-ACP methyl ester carboxylesterase